MWNCYGKVWDESNIFHTIRDPQNYNPTFCMKAIMLKDLMDPQGYITLLKGSIIGRNCITMYVKSCIEC